MGSSVRIWLALWLTIALPLGSRAVEVRSSCHMACARGDKACHSCCGDKPKCHLTSSTAFPITPGTAGLPNPQTNLLLLVLPSAVQPLVTLSASAPIFEQVRDLGPPPRDLLAQDCILLL
jgi:hypothetical protein